MEMVFVKPASGGRVRQPERQNRVMPEEGAFVPLNAHYDRLLLTGDVIRAEAPAAEAQTPARTEPQKSTSAGGRRSSGASEG